MKTITEIEKERRVLTQLETQTRVEKEQLERELSVAQVFAGSAELGQGDHSKALKDLDAIHAAIASKKNLLDALPKKATELDRELVEAQRVERIAPWQAIQKETWQNFDKIDSGLEVLTRESAAFKALLSSGFSSAAMVGQDHEIIWIKMTHFAEHLKDALQDLEAARHEVRLRRPV
jgi:prophage DNA circulation protein